MQKILDNLLDLLMFSCTLIEIMHIVATSYCSPVEGVTLCVVVLCWIIIAHLSRRRGDRS